MNESGAILSIDDRPPGSDNADRSRRHQPIGLLLLWCTVIAVVGGYVCGHALAALAILGSFSFLLLGAMAGWAARAVVGVKGLASAAALSAACLAACLIALIFRLRLADPMMSWEEAFNWLGPSLSSDKVFATFAIGSALSGCLLASFFVLRKKVAGRAGGAGP